MTPDTEPRRANAGQGGALLALLAGAVGISFAAIFVRLSEVGPVATAFWRLLLSLPVVWVWMQLERRRVARVVPTAEVRAERRQLLIAGLFFAADLAVWHWSILYTSVANATLFANVAPVFVTLGSWFLFRRRVTLLFMAGLVTALAGATGVLGSSFSLDRDHVIGDGLGLLTAVFYAGYILSVAELRARTSTATIMTWAGAVSTVVLFVIAVASNETLLPSSARGWWVLIGLALVSQVIGQSLIAYALAHLPATFSSVGLMFQPVCAALFAWLLLAESLGPLQAVGGAVVLAGVVMARMGSLSSRPFPPPRPPFGGSAPPG